MQDEILDEVIDTSPTTEELVNDPILASFEKKMSRIPRLIHGTIGGSLNGAVIGGAPGIGKSFNVEKALNDYGDKLTQTWVKGHITPFSTFMALQDHPNANDVIIFDDADSVFENTAALNILKSACDTKKVRQVSWLSSANLGETSFNFEGKVFILTNVSMKKNKHFQALLDRFLVYDPDVTLPEKLSKIRNLASKESEIPKEVGDTVIDFLVKHEDRIGELSIRTFVKLSQLAQSLGEDWEDIAEHTVLEK